MEKNVRFDLQVQEAKVVTPGKEQVSKAHGWNKKPEAVREIWVSNPEADKEKYPLEHLDARWSKTVYWSEREKTYKPRDPNVPVPWICTPDWKPKTVKETAERRKPPDTASSTERPRLVAFTRFLKTLKTKSGSYAYSTTTPPRYK